MPKTFITEHDIDDMVKRGTLTLELDDNTVLTDLAFEKAQKLGVRLVSKAPYTPPGAPVRPYIATHSQPAGSGAGQTRPSTPSTAPVTPPPADRELHERIRAAVVARLGTQVDAALLDTIIQRVLTSTGLK